MSDAHQIHEIIAELQRHWDAGRFFELATRVGACHDLGRVDSTAKVRMTLSADDAEMLHHAMFLALHFHQNAEGGDDQDSPPDFSPSMN